MIGKFLVIGILLCLLMGLGYVASKIIINVVKGIKEIED